MLEVSPVLEYGSPTPLSTYWKSLHELLVHWTDGDLLLAQPAPGGTPAHRRWSCAPVTQNRRHQAVRHLHEAAHHWSRAAFALDTLHRADLDSAGLARARQLSRIARTQQERLGQLIEEVQRAGSRLSQGQLQEEVRCPDEE